MTGVFQRQKWKLGWNEMSEEGQKGSFFKSWGYNIWHGDYLQFKVANGVNLKTAHHKKKICYNYEW